MLKSFQEKFRPELEWAARNVGCADVQAVLMWGMSFDLREAVDEDDIFNPDRRAIVVPAIVWC